ncbi:MULTISPECIES: DUF5131 family protein [Streptomyces]|uniref:DUF5131 family protein n=1 Tax=Streptomyces mirabilis TaxID=68239 RepID=A0ABU3UGV2_9ACTN|nr:MULTISPECIES: DUF5131 family protein [Streptomyces]MCX4613145.1 phage Gp37/Gp68 family protein [Streptomyces mirabilis]MCX5353275.1 phage Gp37/Gp68 family protein [Streptomyces mirabilis]MDU8993150.1 DUF5131 family protein [Streptomyces mirabilis]
MEQVFQVIAETPQRTYQLLTKRARRLRRLAEGLDWPPNLWMGVSVQSEDQFARIDDLRQVPAAVRFLSCEPLLGPLSGLNLQGIGWVIAGGESGPNHRPLKEEWVTEIRDICREAEVPFFFKQWLLYGTRHALGVEKMKDAMWSVDPAYGVQYRDPKDVQQQALDLEFGPNTDPLRRMLLEFIVGRPGGRMVEDLSQYTLLETVYRPSQVISLIEKMRDDKVVATEPRRVTKKTRVFPYAEKPGQGELLLG